MSVDGTAAVGVGSGLGVVEAGVCVQQRQAVPAVSITNTRFIASLHLE